jgi:putative hydrolase
MNERRIPNQAVADRLREAADLLETQGANPFRVGAYRRAAETISRHRRDLGEILEEEGPDGFDDLPGIGPGIAAAIAEILRTGHWGRLDRMRGSVDPVGVFSAIPGIGPAFATRIHDQLHVDSLEALEVAAHDGRLEQVPGMGPRRAAAVRGALAGMLGRVRGRRHEAVGEGPDVATILAVDREYREQSLAGTLPKIAPRRFNPGGEAWLPVLHTQRGEWHFTLLFSNTARAHELGRTDDWVVVYFYDGDDREGQVTVVTETSGPLAGRRVVRGREQECREYYGKQNVAGATDHEESRRNGRRP